MTMTNDRAHFASEGAPDIDKTIHVNVNRNKSPVVRPTWALKPGLTDRLVVGRNVTLTFTFAFIYIDNIYIFLILRTCQDVFAYPRGVRIPQVEYH
jgi:hypothetical protein